MAIMYKYNKVSRVNFFFFVLLLFFISTNSLASPTLESFNITPKAETVEVSYKIAGDNTKFTAVIIDTLKSGKELKVTHKIKFSNTGISFKSIATGYLEYYISYNLLENSYNYGDKNTYSEAELLDTILSVNNFPIKVKEPLEIGNEYKVSIKVKYGENNTDASWFSYLTSKFKWFNKTIKLKEIYIAR